jgi:hypothetical protein
MHVVVFCRIPNASANSASSPAVVCDYHLNGRHWPALRTALEAQRIFGNAPAEACFAAKNLYFDTATVAAAVKHSGAPVAVLARAMGEILLTDGGVISTRHYTNCVRVSTTCIAFLLWIMSSFSLLFWHLFTGVWRIRIT